MFCASRPLKLLPNPAAAARNTTAGPGLRAGGRAGLGVDALQTQVVRLTPLTTARYQAGISVRKPPLQTVQKVDLAALGLALADGAEVLRLLQYTQSITINSATVR